MFWGSFEKLILESLFVLRVKEFFWKVIVVEVFLLQKRKPNILAGVVGVHHCFEE